MIGYVQANYVGRSRRGTWGTLFPVAVKREAFPAGDEGRCGATGRPTFLEKAAKTFGGGLRRGPAELRAAGFGRIVVVSAGVGVVRAHPALDYGLAFLEVRLGYDGVVD